ncbi:bifunctional adenosylcobinamide kinase/adenosylcobinamide-phosphate guanylyltransferase [Lyngbya confervoides]|uniref:Adenosylcobinamide kinase n=1 Tax=Lyngbya confervoides BDU141951 TaxID=1574623 RepID=A0ABD4T526_9CYAN|nr:bifunctional adenosylcobinamide kinase/adenosylcobinamide-phosphate guanylyltransferase [Lyngbya confervoides]MCM1983518.1 bifunctional adenosylcobinamide kinase/adenosylcobinamide-phosphate guanylyltransferase [Lyngbya confervoides BDU141951]
MSIILVTGPSRSGKSEWAEQIAAQSQLPVFYIATAREDVHDPEWQARIEQHQRRRPAAWVTRPVPFALSDCIAQAEAGDCLLIDSLGTWVANCLGESAAQWTQKCEDLLETLTQTSATVILVSEETGWGLVPSYPTGRLFRDRLGSLTRDITPLTQAAYLVCMGMAINLKKIGVPVPKR